MSDNRPKFPLYLPNTLSAAALFALFTLQGLMALTLLRPMLGAVLYGGLIVLLVGVQAVIVFILRQRLSDPDLWQKVLPFMGLTLAGVWVQAFAVFKIMRFGHLFWAQALLYISIAALCLCQVFYPEFRRSMPAVHRLLSMDRRRVWGVYGAEVLLIGLLVALVFMPDLDAVLARMFTYDKFYHLESFFMAPGWAYEKGLTLNVDITSQYSLIVPIIFNKLAHWTGGFDHAHVVRLLITWVMFYYILFYFFVRQWTGSLLLAGFAVVLLVKLQFFHWGVLPLVWIYPSATPVRFGFDLLFLFFCWRFAQERKLSWLAWAAAVNGLNLVWMADVGLYMWFALAAACAMWAIEQKSKAAWGQVIAFLFMPFLLAFVLLWFFYGSHVGQMQFWHNTSEFAALFVQGWGALPMTDGLKDKQVFAFAMGFAIPLFYVWTLLWSLGRMAAKKADASSLFMLFVCIYGLGLYHYFIHRSAVTSYYPVAGPMVLVLVHWLKIITERLPRAWGRYSRLFFLVWAFTGLTTGYLFAYYPNFLNLSGYVWTPEKNFYHQGFNFEEDAALIERFTSADEPVALLSSFEVKMLMQADRKPYFYYFYLMESAHMERPEYRGVLLHNRERLDKTLAQLQQQPPHYIFIERKLMDGELAQANEAKQEALKILLDYIRGHYQPGVTGKYLQVFTQK